MAFSPKHILAIDDNEAVRDVIVTMLQEHGYRVTAAGDGLSMREILQRDDPVDAIVLDALMPGEQSATLARHARDLNIPVVMISGSHDKIVFALDNASSCSENPSDTRNSWTL
jgi:two-component system OmpR family response regulator